jgi:phospholipid/cholesterol/gamma-HCH transport system substrate-binding protein
MFSVRNVTLKFRFRGTADEMAEEGEEEQGLSPVGLAAALGAMVLAVVVVAWLFFGGATDPYEVKARFANGGQLVKGNPVQTGGVAIGSVSKIAITDGGQADVTLKIERSRAPLHRGTRATIRQSSLSGIANRYVDLSLPSGQHAELPDGGFIGADSTRSAVDLDQLFNTLDPKTRKALQGFFKGNARQFAGRGRQANRGLEYLNPALSTSSRLFNELTRDQPVLERFLVDSSQLVTTLAERRDDLAALIGNLNDTTGALGRQKAALAESVGQLPPFMRRANTTFVNLRSALDDVDPLVDASKPVAKKLDPFLTEAQAFAAGAKPTLRDLSVTIRRPGKANDLINLMSSAPPLARIALDTRNRSVAPGGHNVSVGEVQGAFPESAKAFNDAAPEIAVARPYTKDFLGWFDDFSTTGQGADALGNLARAQINFSESIPVPRPGPLRKFQFKRCPGSAEAPADDGSNVLSVEEMARLQCDESDRSVGDVK